MNNTFQPTGNNDITIKQFFDFVKKSDTEELDDVTTHSRSTKYYLKKFEKYGHQKFFFFINWAGFFGLNWLAYRKMYWSFYILFILAILQILSKINVLPLNSFGTTFEHMYNIMFRIVNISSVLVSIFAGNMIYFYNVRRLVNKSKDYKGVSKIAAVVALFLGAHYFVSQHSITMSSPIVEQDRIRHIDNSSFTKTDVR